VNSGERGIARREMLRMMAAFGALAPFATSACGGSPPPVPTSTPPALDLVSNHDLVACVPGAGLKWLITLRARELAQAPDLIAPLGMIFPDARLSAFAAAHGGVDLRQMQQLILAQYTDTILYGARGPIDPVSVQGAFEKRMPLDGRAEDLQSPLIVRLFGTNPPNTRAQLVTLGRTAAVVEVGKFGPLRAFEAFATRSLHRAKPAIASTPLVDLVPIVGDAVMAAYAPAPFDVGANDFGGLLRVTTGVGIGARVEQANLAVTVALLGGWKDDAPAAGERLSAVMASIAQSSFGRLAGLDAPIREPRVEPRPDALVFTATYSAEKIAQGFHAALDAQVSEIMK
jgi:hypothetical protein